MNKYRKCWDNNMFIIVVFLMGMAYTRILILPSSKNELLIFTLIITIPYFIMAFLTNRHNEKYD